MDKERKKKLRCGGRRLAGRVRRRAAGSVVGSPSGLGLGDDVGDGPGHDMNGLGQPDLGALVPHRGDLGIGGGLRSAPLPGVRASGPQVHGAALDAHGQGDDGAGARVIGCSSQPAAGGVDQRQGDGTQALVDGALDLGVVPHDLRE